MNKKISTGSFFGLILILLLSIVIVSCVHDENEKVSSNNSINISQDITTKTYTKLSPWSEDVDFIQKVQKVFLKNAKLDYFRDKYGDIYWDYAISFPNKLEAGLALPIIKDNNVVMILKATEKNGRIYFQKIDNNEYIGFFKNLILQEKSLQIYTNGAENSIRKVAGIDKMAVMEYKCTYRTVSIGCANGHTDCPPSSKTISECSWIDTGGPDYESIAPFDEGGGGGGDGGYELPPLTKPNQEIINNLKDYPCAQKLVEQLPDLNNSLAKLIKDTFGESNKDIKVIFHSEIFKSPQDNGLTTAIIENGNLLGFDVALNQDILKTATQEYVLATMYHEFIHAYLGYEFKKLGPDAYSAKYPHLENYVVNGITKFRFKEGDHQAFTPFVSMISDAIMSYAKVNNPNFPQKVANALAMKGLITEKDLNAALPDAADLYNQSERYSEKSAQGVKCTKP
ncbi:hypothetical protein [Elizabethkingia ursingii]|uniref:SprT-like domain-containing protein n=1 Tax=Elizabethkingia ursingii TaxID=1756150 RepID=A0AAJ3NBG2_9FLAO|nr:hypothetical protein [Elizabethkingia ursingii]AQX09182.1 hypothetical protein BBD34_11255 [Elizabethkingia ursingii]OPB74449.1 hypothetical protein BAY32_08935 [Elizabethkingia ursingii]OPB93398.1 hypothetical protein BB021_03145 [Elizabethkingia ursingii]